MPKGTFRAAFSASLFFAFYSGQAAGLPPRLSIAVEIVPLDDATHGQSRHVENLLMATGKPEAWFDLEPWTAASVGDCGMRQDFPSAEECVRTILSSSWKVNAQPVHVGIIIGPGTAGETRAYCVGVGGKSKSPERQMVMINSYGFHAEDEGRHENVVSLAGCIAAAGSESGW